MSFFVTTIFLEIHCKCYELENGINNDLATNLTNNVVPIPDNEHQNKEHEKIDLDVNSATEELPIRSEKQSVDDSQQKVPPLENFDSANFFSDNE